MSGEVKAPLPTFRVYASVKYFTSTAKILGCWWDEHREWRYLISVARGKRKGDWSVSETELKRFN